MTDHQSDIIRRAARLLRDGFHASGTAEPESSKKVVAAFVSFLDQTKRPRHRKVSGEEVVNDVAVVTIVLQEVGLANPSERQAEVILETARRALTEGGVAHEHLHRNRHRSHR